MIPQNNLELTPFQAGLKAAEWRDYPSIEQGLERLLKPYIPLLKHPEMLSALGATYPRRTMEMELLSRLLWGAVPLICGSGGRAGKELLPLLIQGLDEGTNPTSPRYWGEPEDYSQLLVEMPGLAFAILLDPEHFWEPLDKKAQERILRWMTAINRRMLPECNWKLFPLLVNAAFLKVRPELADTALMRKAVRTIRGFYLEEGWYNDGDPKERRSRDYYIPWAYYYFGQLFTHFCPDFDRSYTEALRDQSRPFAAQYRQWFDRKGRALPFGRSLTYRYAQGAFWGAQLFTQNIPLPTGEIKSLWLENLRWWMSRPIFSETGIQQIGYSYPNLFMSERYNAPSSPLWALQTFLPLALGPEATFWGEEETHPPVSEKPVCQKQTGFLICSSKDGSQKVALSAGQWTPGPQNEHNHFAEKYEKFAYSTAFGFQVALDSRGADKMAPDNMLLLSQDGEEYRSKRESRDFEVTDLYCRSRWYPFPGVEVILTQVPRFPWIYRFFQVETNRELLALEGGFPLPYGDRDWGVPRRLEEASGVLGLTEYGGCGIWDPSKTSEGALQICGPNANLLHPNCAVPVLRRKLPSGKSEWITAVLADTKADEAEQLWKFRPQGETFEEIFRALNPGE